MAEHPPAEPPSGAGGGTAADPVLYIALLQLVTALWHEIDHGDGSGASAFFTPDADLVFSQRAFSGTAAIDEVYRTRTARGRRVSRHVVTNLHLLRSGPRSAEAVSTLVLYAQDGQPPIPSTAPVLVADVHDEFARVEGGRWLIRRRRLEPCFLAPGDVLAVPTE